MIRLLSNITGGSNVCLSIHAFSRIFHPFSFGPAFSCLAFILDCPAFSSLGVLVVRNRYKVQHRTMSDDLLIYLSVHYNSTVLATCSRCCDCVLCLCTWCVELTAWLCWTRTSSTTPLTMSLNVNLTASSSVFTTQVCQRGEGGCKIVRGGLCCSGDEAVVRAETLSGFGVKPLKAEYLCIADRRFRL